MLINLLSFRLGSDAQQGSPYYPFLEITDFIIRNGAHHSNIVKAHVAEESVMEVVASELV
jgi:hypothetical protein